jgi:hypothetical protein
MFEAAQANLFSMISGEPVKTLLLSKSAAQKRLVLH